MRTRRLVPRVLALSALIAGLVLAPPATSGAMASTVEKSAVAGGRPLFAVLTGAAEVPGPGDPDGAGVAVVQVNPGREKVCYALAVRRVDEVVAAHIHRGAADVAGPIVVPLTAPAGGFSVDCATVDRELAAEIVSSPGDFYVNVHSAEFPAGAVRGQLG